MRVHTTKPDKPSPIPTSPSAQQGATSSGLQRETSAMEVETPMSPEFSAATFGDGHAAHKPLTLLPLVALIFYDVCGGPFGIEDAVSTGSPLLALLGFMLLPCIWSVPEALVTAELATTFPENSGYVAWVTAAYGPFWGFQEGFWKWLSGVTDNAVYPVMFLAYFEQVLPIVASGLPRLILLVLVNLALTYLNYRGLHVVGNFAVAMTVFTLVPFGLLSIMGLPHMKPSNWFKLKMGNVKWGPFLNIMFWNLNYWDSVSTLAGEVDNPSKTFPKALGAAVILVVTSYLVPLLVGLGVSATASEWKLGYFADLAEQIGGTWLAWWIVAAAAVSQIGQFEAEMCADSFQLAGMAERGFIPKAFNKRSEFGTPTVAILFSSLGIMTMASFNFMQIVELLNIVYCMAELLEFMAFIQLRIKYPSLNRPYKIPLSTLGCTLMLAPAFILLVGLLAVPVLEGDRVVLSFTIAVSLVGALLYPALQLARQNNWFEFEAITPHLFKERLYTVYSKSSIQESDEEALLSSSRTVFES